MEINSSTIQLFSIVGGFGIAFFADLFPYELRDYIKVLGFFIVLVPALQEFVMPYYSASHDCYHILIENKARCFDAFIEETMDLEDIKHKPTLHYRLVKTWKPCEVSGSDEYADYFGKFSGFRLVSNRGRIGDRLKFNREYVELLGAVFVHRAVTIIIVEDISRSDEYRGERVPTFFIKKVLQGDYEKRIPSGDSRPYVVVKDNIHATNLLRGYLHDRDVKDKKISELRIREQTHKQIRQDTEMLNDSRNAAIKSFIGRQRGEQVEARFFATHVEDQEKGWKNTSKALKTEKYPKWLLPVSIIGIIALIFAAVYTNPEATQQITDALNQPFTMIAVVLVAIVIVIILYLLRRRIS